MWTIGFTSSTIPGSLDNALQWADENGFSAIEISGGHTLGFQPFFVNQIKDLFGKYKVKPSALGCFHNFLEGSWIKRQYTFKLLKNAIQTAAGVGIPIVTCFAGQNNHTDYKGNLKLFKQEWIPMIKYAANHSIKIAIENCPAKSAYALTGGNLMTSPGIWADLFAISPENFGLNLDPSHLHWQLVDPSIIIEEFGDRIFHIHAKDTLIFKEKRDFVGIYGNGTYTYRLPGRGEISWQKFLNTLKEFKYNGVLSIEHEDGDYLGTTEKAKAGLLLAKKYLDQF